MTKIKVLRCHKCKAQKSPAYFQPHDLMRKYPICRACRKVYQGRAPGFERRGETFAATTKTLLLKFARAHAFP